MTKAGMQVEYIPNAVIPHGNDFFNHSYVENYAQTTMPEAVVVLSTGILGHEDMKAQLETYHLWDVGGSVFPKCEDRRHR